jgi:hypothetical protein
MTVRHRARNTSRTIESKSEEEKMTIVQIVLREVLSQPAFLALIACLDDLKSWVAFLKPLQLGLRKRPFLCRYQELRHQARVNQELFCADQLQAATIDKANIFRRVPILRDLSYPFLRWKPYGLSILPPFLLQPRILMWLDNSTDVLSVSRAFAVKYGNDVYLNHFFFLSPSVWTATYNEAENCYEVDCYCRLCRAFSI